MSLRLSAAGHRSDWARVGLSTVLVLIAAACDGGTRTEPSRDLGTEPSRDLGADVNTCSAHCGGFSCSGGVIRARVLVPNPCGLSTFCVLSPYVSPDVCERGCREGVSGLLAEDVCEENVPKSVGEVCAVDGDCTPGRAVPDGLGGTTPLALACDTSTNTCIEVLVERCNGVDDDADGTIDEGCAFESRIVARLPRSAQSLDAEFAADRIALMSETSSEASVTVVTPDGAPLGEHTGLRFASEVEREDGGWAVMRHDILDGTNEVVRLRDDGTRLAVALRDPVIARYATMKPFRGSYLVIGLTSGVDGMELGRYDTATGARTATGLAPLTTNLTLGAAPLGADLLLFSASYGAPMETARVTPALAVTTPEPATLRPLGALAGFTSRDGRSYAVVESRASDYVLATIDEGTGAWVEVAALGRLMDPTPTTYPPTVVADRATFVVSWVDAANTLRSLILDSAGVRVGSAEVELGDAPRGVWAGSTDAGPRIVVGAMSEWILIAPAAIRAP